MSELTDIAKVEEAKELARNDYSANKPYGSTVAINSGIAVNAVDNGERIKELARNDYSANKPYNFSSLGN